MNKILKAVQFSANKHRNQRRKDKDATPYINHAIDVAAVISNIGNVTDEKVIIAAILHDAIEDTETTWTELEQNFGHEIVAIVKEVTDNKSLPKQLRKDLQIQNASSISYCAKLIKLADKICNIKELDFNKPTSWSIESSIKYANWCKEVVDQCNVNDNLTKYFNDLHKIVIRNLEKQLNSPLQNT